MTQAPTQKREPIGNDWLEDFRRQFSDEFPEPQCEAQRAVEGVGSSRPQSDRFPRGEGA